MKINVNQKLKTVEGQTMKDVGSDGKAVEATLKMAIVNSLLAPLQQGQNESGIEKVKKYELAMRVYKGGEVELTVEDIALIKKQIGDVYPPLIVGQTFDLLEKSS